MPDRKTLSLCMVVKDEETTLKRAVRSLGDLPDQIVIGVDKASNEETRELARGLADETFDFEFGNDFSAIRNQAIERCTGDYVFILDGHERLAPPSIARVRNILTNPPDMDLLLFTLLINVDRYHIPQLFFVQPRLFVNGKGIHYTNAVHNCLSGHDPNKTLAVPDVLLIHNMPRKREAVRKEQRADMNIKGLQEDIKKDPSNPRAYFYMANTLADLNRGDEAIQWYEKYLTMGSTFAPEIGQAHIQLGVLYRRAKNWEKATNHSKQAVVYCWDRAEPYVLLGEIAGAQGKFGEAIHWYKMAANVPAPMSVMFLQGKIYSWIPHWELARLYDRTGQHKEALTHCLHALAYTPNDKEMLAAKENLTKIVLGKPNQSFDTWRYTWQRSDM